MTNPLERIPTEWWPFIAGAGALAFLGTLTLVGWAGIRFGRRRRSGAEVTPADKARDKALFRAAVVAGAVVWLVQVIGSYEGLTVFANIHVGWIDWREILVPFSLDGTSIAFGFLAFRAVAKRRSPYACYAVVWSAAGASAWFNFLQGGEHHNSSAGMYLAFLSMTSMIMLHVFLEQFREGTELVIRKNPKFGMRWATYLPNTLCAWLAWTNHPVATGTEPTLASALTHLAAVREAKRGARHARYAEAAQWATAWWMHAVPWLRVRHFTAALTAAQATYSADLAAARAEANAALAEQHATMTAAKEAEVAEITARLEQVAAEYTAAMKTGAQELADRDEMAKLLREEQEANLAAERAQVEDARADAARAIERLRTQHATERATLVAAHADEISTFNGRLQSLSAERAGLQQQTAVAAERDTATAELLNAATQRAERAEHNVEVLQRRLAEQGQVLHHEVEAATLRVRNALNAEVQQLRADHNVEVQRLNELHQQEIATAQAQRSTSTRAPRKSATPGGSTPGTGDVVRMSATHNTDLSALLQELLSKHPEPSFRWSQNKVRDILGCRWPTASALVEALQAHHQHNTATPVATPQPATAADHNATRQEVSVS